MHEVNGILQQIVIKILVQVQQEVQTNFLGVAYKLFIGHFHFFYIAVCILNPNYTCIFKHWFKELYIRTRLPSLLSNNFFSLIVDEINRRIYFFSLWKVKCKKYRQLAQINSFEQVIIPRKACWYILEPEVAFSQCTHLLIENVDIIDNSSLVYGVNFIFITVAYQSKDIWCWFPKIPNIDFYVIEVILLSDGVFYLYLC